MKKMRKLCFLLGAMAFCAAINAQERPKQLSIMAGFEYFPEMGDGKGVAYGLEFKSYLNKRVYVVGQFFGAYNDRSRIATYSGYESDNQKIELTNSRQDYALCMGVGVDFLSCKGHRLYVQIAPGIGSMDMQRDHISAIPFEKPAKAEPQYNECTRLAVIGVAGYDYIFKSNLILGVNYTGSHIGYDYNSGAMVKVGYQF